MSETTASLLHEHAPEICLFLGVADGKRERFSVHL
jgi:hypothetical protein